MIQLQSPSTLSIDFLGVINQVGEGISHSDFRDGDEVYGQACLGSISPRMKDKIIIYLW